MHLDSGCHEHLKARSEGNPGWKRLPSVTCIPNKQQNPMMWPFDAPGKTWLHDSKDSTKDPGQWPYKSTDLRNFVESAPPSPAWADGIWYRASACALSLSNSIVLSSHSILHLLSCLSPGSYPLAGTSRILPWAACRRRTTPTGTSSTAPATPSGAAAPLPPRPRRRSRPGPARRGRMRGAGSGRQG